MYLRFVTRERDHRSHVSRGVFVAAYDLRDRDAYALHERVWFDEVVGWFEWNLAVPSEHAWALRPGEALCDRVVFWLRADAHEHVQRMRDVACLLRHMDVPMRVLRSAQPGRIVYRDAHQIGAIPHRDGLR